MRSALIPRVLGALTAAYGAYTLARPHSLARVAGLVTPDRPAPRATRNLGWAIGARDLVSGAADDAAPRQVRRCGPRSPSGWRAMPATRSASASRCRASSRAKVIAVAAGWGLICAAAFPATGRRS